MKYKNVLENIGNSWTVTKDALGDFVKPMQSVFYDLGKRRSDKWIYSQGQESPDVRKLNFLAAFKMWIAVFILSGNRQGAEMILNDIEIFVRLCRQELNLIAKPISFPVADRKIWQVITRLCADTGELRELMAGWAN